ncbi:carboxypeptidase S [Cryphonectria parasitica EP155]|uniref:Carboxypeptidase S n=1 Tax=Cryphonectria parasitica (strain ATCC 38755 / EP155) TaxID=660469 RepID=A0A9P5CQK4_CRYP1|nr:carboxypeptidase S [Cryphonectria parasitica EP155]KAF3766160.1 carboxypeptidase S [Cryphonectria parasitica EP155]
MSFVGVFFPFHRPHHGTDFAQQCRQVDPLFPGQKSPALDSMDEYLASPQFLNASVPRLAGAVQIPTQSYDTMGAIGDDARWDVFYDLAQYLEQTFPLVYSTLQLEKVNTHGLLYTWEGSDASLKPTVFMAHQDTVPVELSTIEQWTHPPWSGEFDGSFLWGRGSSDCKNNLIGILEAVELLIDAGFKPKRSLVLSFGFDEEISGAQGAGHLAEAILAKYGKDGAAIIVDEGSGLMKQFGTVFSLPAVAEKGYIDVDVIVRMPGGHSSVPPKHNGIGVMGELITHLEANIYEPRIYDENPTLGLLQCGAAFAPDFPHKLKKELRHRISGDAAVCHKKDRLALEAAKISDPFKYLFTTSQAADLIGGGAKINALPERTVLTVNHRVNVGGHTSDVKAHITEIAAHVAKKFNLTLHAFPEGEGETPSSITLKVAFHSTLEPAPVSPFTYDGETNAWSILSGTTRALYGEDLIMAPALSTGNTDTKYYWDLTNNIYRYGPGYDEEQDAGLGGIHTVDERVSMRAHVKGVQWYSMFVRNMDEADL